MAITSASRARRLERAWDMTKTTGLDLRKVLRNLEDAQGKVVEAGTMSSVSANGRNSQFFNYGPGVETPAEVADLYRQLVVDFDEGRKFLKACAAFGLDPFIVEFQFFPSGPSQVQQPVVLDSTGRFLDQCDTFGIDSTVVVNKPVNDASIFCWMMYHEVPVTVELPDYTWLNVGQGSQFV